MLLPEVTQQIQLNPMHPGFTHPAIPGKTLGRAPDGRFALLEAGAEPALISEEPTRSLVRGLQDGWEEVSP